MTWEKVFEFADPALHNGLLKAHSEHWSIPDVFARLKNGEVLDLAWTDRKIGVSLTEKSHKYENWEIWGFDDFYSNILDI